MPRRVAGVGALALAIAAGLGAVSALDGWSAARAAPGMTATLTCEDAILGQGDPKWRKRSTVTGPFGFYGSGRNFKKWAWKNNHGFFVGKVPAVAEGSTPVTVRISDRDVNRAALTYGFGAGGSTVADSLAEVRFEPCVDRSPTGWPGGFVLKKRTAVKLFVQVEGESTARRIAVGKHKRG